MAGKRKITVRDKDIDRPEMEELFNEMVASLDISREDVALSKLLMAGVPALADLASEDRLLAGLVAMEPKLTMAELESACAKIEDLAIALLVATRSERHVAKAGMTAEGADALGAETHGDEAIEILETMKAQHESLEIDLDPETVPLLPPIMTPETVEASISQIRAAMGKGRSKSRHQ